MSSQQPQQEGSSVASVIAILLLLAGFCFAFIPPTTMVGAILTVLGLVVAIFAKRS